MAIRFRYFILFKYFFLSATSFLNICVFREGKRGAQYANFKMLYYSPSQVLQVSNHEPVRC